MFTQLRGQDLNLRPSGYESAEKAPIEPDSPEIVTGETVVVAPDPAPNPAIARAGDRRTIAEDDSEKARALVRAALALLDAAPAEARRLLEGAMGLLGPATSNVIRIRERSGG